ncbi:MAG: hypothetical protein KDD47_13895 [Acidobacteria bacterium]|nr:hypothetical protein [Acidobacteriota bacterium]
MKPRTSTYLFAAMAVAVLLAIPLSVPAAQQDTTGQQPDGTSDTAVALPVPVTLVRLSAATTASSYTAGTSIGIVATLTNRSGQALGLSNIEDGNLVVTSVTLGDAVVASLGSMTNYEDGFPLALSGSLVSIANGGSLSIPWSSDFVQDFGGEGLKATAYTGADIGTSTYYDLSQPGTYKVTFHYKYKGPTSSFPGTVFTGKTNSVTVTFTVV